MENPDDADISIGILVQLILMNDVDILTSKSLWDDDVFEIARKACNKQLNLQDFLIALREEKIQRENAMNSEQSSE